MANFAHKKYCLRYIHTLYLLLTRLNLGSRLIWNKRKARYCWNTSTWNCCIPPLMNQHHHSYHLMLPSNTLKCWCGLSLQPFNSILKNPSSPYWYRDGYLSSVGPSSGWMWKMQHQEWDELLTHFILNCQWHELLLAINAQKDGVMHAVCKLLFRAHYIVHEP